MFLVMRDEIVFVIKVVICDKFIECIVLRDGL